MSVQTKERFINLPNVLTLLRIGLVPVFVMMKVSNRALGALLVFSVAGATDVLDGFVARTFHLRTRIGMLLDPVADKLLLSTAFVLLTIRGWNDPYVIPLWLTIVVISRDFIILAGSLVISLLKKASAFPPSVFGKISTICQIGTVFWVLLANTIQRSSWANAALLSSLTSARVLSAIYVLTLASTIVSWIFYVLKGIRLTFFPQPQ